MVFRSLFVAVLLLGLTGCLHRGECRAHGGPEWRELTTPHFRIRTDLDSESARIEAEHLERQRQTLLLYFPGIDPPVIDTVILDGVEEFNEYMPRSGGFTRFDDRGLLLVYSTYPLKRRWEVNTTAGNSLTHALSAFETPYAPAWYSAGLGLYFAMAEFDETGRSATVGEWELRQRDRALSWGLYGIEDLRDWEARGRVSDEENVRFNASAEVWMHFLMNRHRAELYAFRQRLARDEDWDDAFEQTIGKLKDLDAEANDYLKNGSYQVETHTFPASSPTIEERLMTDAEVHLARLAIREKAPVWQSRELKTALARLELREANALAPQSFDVRLMTAERTADAAERKRLSSELVKDHPDRFEAWRQLGIAEEDREKKLQALLKAVELSKGTDPLTIDALAPYLDPKARKTTLNFEIADRLFRDRPWDTVLLGFRGEAADYRDDCAATLETLERLMNRSKRDGAKACEKHFSEARAWWQSRCDEKAREKTTGATE